MKLIPVDKEYYFYLYQLLDKRPAYANISHKKMPSYKEHVEFLDRVPYKEHWIVMSESCPVGQVYLTRNNEVGIQIEDEYQRSGAGTWALTEMMSRHPGERLLANIAPANQRSQMFFEKMGFELIQFTYAFNVPSTRAS